MQVQTQAAAAGQPETVDEQPLAAPLGDIASVETSPIEVHVAPTVKNAIVRHHLTDDERASLLVEYVKLGRKPPYGAVKALCERFGVSRRYASNLEAQYDRSTSTDTVMSFKRKSGSGRPSKITPENAEF